MNTNWIIFVVIYLLASFVGVRWLWNWLRQKTRGAWWAKFSGPVLYFLAGALFVWILIPCQ